MKSLKIFLLIGVIILINTKTAKEVVDCVHAQLGKPYVWGGSGPDVFDCSGLAFYCHDGQIPRVAQDQANSGREGDGSPGDLVFFGESSVTHVGVCTSKDVMVHAPTSGQVVSPKNYRGPWYAERFKGFKRYWEGTGYNDPNLDVTYYARKYEDIRNAFGYDNDLINQHWRENGKREGRSPNIYFDPKYYSEHNPDIKNAFGENWEAVINHFFTNGVNEYRDSSPVYYGEFYKNSHSDLSGHNSQDLINHFNEYGMKEGRKAHPSFDPQVYKNLNQDLIPIIGDNMREYYYHYVLHGIPEGRKH